MRELLVTVCLLKSRLWLYAYCLLLCIIGFCSFGNAKMYISSKISLSSDWKGLGFNSGTANLFKCTSCCYCNFIGSRGQHLSLCCQTSYEQVLLSNPTVILSSRNLWIHLLCCLTLTVSEYDCLIVIDYVLIPQSDFPNYSDIPIPNIDLLLFFGGPCVRNTPGCIKASYAVVSLHDVLKYYVFPN